MSAYESFGDFYDLLQKDVPYRKMAEVIDGFIKKYSSEKECIVDLACGTGNLAEELAEMGYEVQGIELSEEMLTKAFDKNKDDRITYYHQDMTQLQLWGMTDVMVCTLDSLNHLENSGQLEEVFDRAGEYVFTGGLFIFDVNTKFKHREILGNNAFVYDYDEVCCVWQNQLNDDDSVDIFLDFFRNCGNDNYKRFHDEFTEIIFEKEEIEKSLEKNNFEIIGIFDGYSEKPLAENSQRALYVCRKLEV